MDKVITVNEGNTNYLFYTYYLFLNLFPSIWRESDKCGITYIRYFCLKSDLHQICPANFTTKRLLSLEVKIFTYLLQISIEAKKVLKYIKKTNKV